MTTSSPCSRRLGARTGDASWSSVAERFQTYESEPPLIRVASKPRDPAAYAQGALPLLALEVLERDLPRREDSRPGDAGPRLAHDSLVAEERHTRDVPSAADRSRADGAASVKGPPAGQDQARGKAHAASMRLAGLAAAVAALVLALPAQSANRLQPVPILMYHVVSNAPANAP